MFYEVIMCVLGLLVVSYWIFDINFSIRAFFAYFYARYFRSKLGFLEKSEIYGICYTTDIDVNLRHMNNAKYIRELEFGRLDFCVRAGLVNILSGFKNGTRFVISGTILRYTKAVMLFATYKITTSVVWWDTRSFYVEQKIITLKDDSARGIGYTKFTFINPQDLQRFVVGLEKPAISPSLAAYIDANDSIEFPKTKIVTENME